MADIVTEYVCNIRMLQPNDNLHINNVYSNVKDFKELSFISNSNNNMSNAITTNNNNNSAIVSGSIISTNISNGIVPSDNNSNSVCRCGEELATELGNDFNSFYFNNNPIERSRMVAALDVMLHLLLPLVKGVARSVKGIRDVIFLASFQKITVSRRILTNLFALAANAVSLSLSSVQVSQRIELLLQHLKIRKSPQGLESLADTPTPFHSRSTAPTSSTLNNSPIFRNIRLEQPADKCCTLNVLAEPSPGVSIRADIIFVHGLHGSQMNTWKQGRWENDRSPENFQRPPQLPLRPPKRPRHSRTSGFRPPHKRKRARFQLVLKDCDQQFSQSFDDSDLNEHSCYDSTDTQLCTRSEYSFSAFRLRANDHSRQIQAEFNTKCKLIPEAGSTHSKNFNDPTHDQAFDAHDTTKSTSKSSPNYHEYSKCWPSDWLPLDCPGVRVMALNYTTDQHLWRPLWKKKENRTNLVQRSREMTELLIKHRVGHGHPIIWVGHSKGGLFIKQILVDAWESGRPAAVPLWRSSRGVFFYSVPHRGSHLASIKAPLLTRSVELIDIEKNSKYLIDLHRRFVCLYQLGHLKIEVFSFVETALTLLSVLYLRIVGVDSADPGIGDVCGIHLDHREICKPRSRDCILYKELIKMIKKVC